MSIVLVTLCHHVCGTAHLCLTLLYLYSMRSNVTTPDVRLTSHVPCSVNLLSEQEIVHSRNHRSEAARGQERLETWEGCCVGDLETPSDHLCENAFYCVPVILSTDRKVSVLCKDMRGSRISWYSAITMKFVVSWRLNLHHLIALN